MNRTVKLKFAIAALAFMSLAHAETGVTDTKITVGQFAAFSGESALLGTRVNAGIAAYFAEVNANGGVNGRKLDLVTRDDSYDAAKAKIAVKELIDNEKVFALIGSVGTPTTLAARDVFTNSKVPLVGPVTGAEALRQPFNKYIFHVRAGYNEEVYRLIKYLSPSNMKRVALLANIGPYGDAGVSALDIALGRVNPTLAKNDQINHVGTVRVPSSFKDRTDAAAKIELSVNEVLKDSPESILMFSTYKTTAEFIRQAKAKGYRGLFYTVSFVGSKALADEFGEKNDRTVVISQVVPFPFLQINPLSTAYHINMKRFGDGQLDFSSMEGYMVAKVFVEGLQKAGRNLTRESFISALENVRAVSSDMLPTALPYGPGSHAGTNFVELTFLNPDGRFLR